MLRLGRANCSRAYALLAALTENEITLREFADEISPLTPEELQVMATVLFSFGETEPDSAKQRIARACCLRSATTMRALC
jgi:thiaminase